MSATHFSNPTVSIEQLPSILALDKQSLCKKYAPINRLLNLSLTLLFCLIGTALYFQSVVNLSADFLYSLPYIIWSVALLAKNYTLRELDLHYASGLFFKKVVSQPITRIQHIELKRGPIERKVGLATLQVFSAGGDMHTFQIPGLPIDTAQQLRQFILQHKDVVKHG
jgi:membrane protein YdbS with pleckstrin-like domain